MPRIKEVLKEQSNGNKQESEAKSVFRKLFSYLQVPKTNIVSDDDAQSRWFTKGMRKDLKDHTKRIPGAHENPDYPHNGHFLGVWNYPTSFSIVGARHYNFADEQNPTQNRVIVDVLFEWDKKESICNQYPGDKRLNAYIFVFEDGKWKLDDYYIYDNQNGIRGEFRKRASVLVPTQI